jgi:hypothetical protein
MPPPRGRSCRYGPGVPGGRSLVAQRTAPEGGRPVQVGAVEHHDQGDVVPPAVPRRTTRHAAERYAGTATAGAPGT